MDEQDQQHVAVAEGGSAKPWGFWRTAGWGLVAFAAFVGAQVGVVALLGVEDQSANGLQLAVATILGGLAGMAALWAVVRRKFDVYDYLSLRWPKPRALVLWVLAGAGFWIAFSVLGFLLDQSTPQFMENVYNTAGSPALLFVAVVVVAPLFAASCSAAGRPRRCASGARSRSPQRYGPLCTRNTAPSKSAACSSTASCSAPPGTTLAR